jgi:uncharacterized protein YutE (UPF0331/DUF86 family)
MVDEALILRKLSELDEYHKQITEYQTITTAQYSGDWKVQRIVERTLQMMIETCVDIAGHLISDKELRVPTSYSDAFLSLKENRVLDEALFTRLKKMAKFRNVVVHHYDKVDAEIVVGILKRNLSDFIDYRDEIVRFLKSEHAKG